MLVVTGIWRRVLGVTVLVLAQCAVMADRPATAAAIASARSGSWSSPSTWDLGRVPDSADVVTIRHKVSLDRNARVAGIVIAPDARLRFAPRRSSTLTSTGNVVVHGTLQMRPASGARTHALVFDEVTEGSFQGGGNDPVSTDVGLWVRPGGRLAAFGARKAAWTRATTSIPAGTRRFRVRSARGWRRGDAIALGPTKPGELREAFEVLTIARVRNRAGRVTLTSATDRGHVNVKLPKGRVMRPEVLNLTRNVRIEGTPAGRSHVHLYGVPKHRIGFVALRHMGVPVDGNNNRGRYALHFHQAGSRTRGSVVAGVVARDVGTHAFVPHASHGITFRRTIAYDFEDAAYWWDRLESDERVSLTHDTKIKGCVAANGAQAGVMHQFGLRNSMIGCVAYGIANSENGAAGRGFAWDEVPTNQEPFERKHAVWKWRDGIAHNAAAPIWVWQNDAASHNVVRPISYWPTLSGARISNAGLHGAYSNVYHYVDGIMFGDFAFNLHAASGKTSSGRRQEHRNMVYDAAGGEFAFWIARHNLAGAAFGLIRGCTIQNFTRAAVLVNEHSTNEFSRGADYTFRNCRTGNGSPLMPEDFAIEDLHPQSEICIQNGDRAWMIDGAGAVYIVKPTSSCP